MEAVLQNEVLVLNRVYLPVHITSVFRAFSQVYTGGAKVVDSEYRTFDFESWSELSQSHAASSQPTIGSAKQRFLVPRVILLSSYDSRPRYRIRLSRMNVYLRDSSTCQYCGQRFERKDLNLDHVLPRSRGGKTTWENIVCSCIRCNLKKGNRTPNEASMSLLKPPTQPRWSPIFRNPARRLYREWLPFLSEADLAYWNVELEAE